MPYLTQQQYMDWYSENELIQFTARDGSQTVDVVVFNEAVERAGKRIDGYINSRYQLPLSQAFIDASSLSDTCGIITRHLLNKDCTNEELQKRYDDAIRWLKDVSSGRVSLGAVDTTTQTENKVVAKAPKSNFDWGAY